MHLTTTTAPYQAKPCIRDYSELITSVIPEPVAKAISLKQLRRRCAEVNRTHPRYREETPLLLALETKRRAILAGPHMR